MDAVSLYIDIVKKAMTQNAPVQYQLAPESSFCLKMAKHHHPWSIKSVEFDTIRRFIADHNLQRGYECATAFGISAVAAGFGFRQTGGKLLTLDAYIEEIYNDCHAYENVSKVNESEEPDGLKSVRWLTENYQLQDVIVPVKGWSPTDVPAAVHACFGSDPRLDYAFIDAGHWDDALISDLTAIHPLFAEKYAVFIHDTNAFGASAIDCCERLFGRRWRLISGCMYPFGFNMGIVTNLI